VWYNPRNLEPLEKSQENSSDHYMVELRFYIPNFVAEWLTLKANEVFKKRNTYVRDLLVALWRRENGR
jgi:hypothetical protein